MYRGEDVRPGHQYLDEDVADIQAVGQQLEALIRLTKSVKEHLVSDSAKAWADTMVLYLEETLQDTCTRWLIDNGLRLQANREPF
jgi:hypothetical protein